MSSVAPRLEDTLFFLDDSPLALESDLQRAGYRAIAGVDEAGRGALAGPVVAAAVVLSPRAKELVGRVRDSKKLTALQRESLLPEIHACAASVGVGIVEADEIDRINILRAALKAMALAVGRLALPPDLCLIDGNQKAPVAVPQRVIIKGDDRVLSIAAASIVAKVTRDGLMAALAAKYPAYGFEENKGYGTGLHLEALRKHGPSPIHRRSFSLPVP